MAQKLRKISKPILVLPVNFAGCTPLLRRDVVSAGITTLRTPSAERHAAGQAHMVLFGLAGLGVAHTPAGELGLKRGELWVIPAAHAYTLLPRPAFQFMWFALRPGRIWAHLDGLKPHRRFAGQSLRMVEVLRGLCAEATSPCEDRLQMGQAFSEILAIYLARRLQADSDLLAQRQRQQLAALWEIVDADLQRPWSVADLARQLHVSPSHLYRLTRKCQRTAPMQVLTQLRISRTRELLAHTELKLDAIAEAVGYQTAYALSKAFKRQQGTSPRNYRRQQQAVRPPRR